MSSTGKPHLDVAVPHPHVKGGLPVCGGPAESSAVREAIAARVAGAHDAAVFDPALVKWTTLMSTTIQECMQRSPVAHEHDAHATVIDHERNRLRHGGFICHSGPRLGRLQEGRVIHPSASTERQMS